MKCTAFEPGGELIAVPQDSAVLEIRNPGRPIVKVEWNPDCNGSMSLTTIEQKYYSARIVLAFPGARYGGDAAHYVVRYTVERQAP